jgi:hypothetical protein
LRSEVLGLMFLLRELVGFFFVTRTDDSKTQVPSFCQKKGPKSPKYISNSEVFFLHRQCLRVLEIRALLFGRG